ncbi:hypothetical protein Tco_0410482 [Tanacetum coccineum]
MNFSILKRSFSLNTSKTPSKPYQDLEVDEPPFSVLKGEGLCINKILSRDSSFGHSACIYYSSTPNLGVPFQWEKKPGMPILSPREEVILRPPPPPPLPPPALQSLVLTRPNVDMKYSSISWRFWSWRRRLCKNTRIKIYGRRWYHVKFSSNITKGKKVSSLDGDSDAELLEWIHHDSQSSSSSTVSKEGCLDSFDGDDSSYVFVTEGVSPKSDSAPDDQIQLVTDKLGRENGIVVVNGSVDVRDDEPIVENGSVVVENENGHVGEITGEEVVKSIVQVVDANGFADVETKTDDVESGDLLPALSSTRRNVKLQLLLSHPRKFK